MTDNAFAALSEACAHESLYATLYFEHKGWVSGDEPLPARPGGYTPEGIKLFVSVLMQAVGHKPTHLLLSEIQVTPDMIAAAARAKDAPDWVLLAVDLRA